VTVHPSLQAGRPAEDRGAPGSRRRAALFRVLLPALTVLGTLVVLEAVARVGLSLHLLAYDPPMETVRPPGTDDWRLAHITADRYRQPDPLLWWRPVAEPPYNRQGFKGPEVEVPKPAGTVRVVAYGDSNTDGPPTGDWPEDLGRLLAAGGAGGGGRVEVVNAGVAGYTSRQGLLRFGEEAGRLAPDVVLVSFGWNDLARVAVPDRAFRPPGRALAALQRLALRLRFYRVARHYLRSEEPPPDAPLVPRVELSNYVANLRGFVALGREHGAAVVLLTRPHRETVAQLLALAPQWLSGVPEYNDAVRRVGREEGVPVIDVQRAFAEGPPDLFADACHFTLEGHEVMARLVRDELQRLGLLAPRPRASRN
jgi:lysophospholipase L1-like esterase